MLPTASLDFGDWPKGQTTLPLTITLTNDAADPASQTIVFAGKSVSGDYLETDDCGSSLAPGASCTISVTFTPQVVGFDQGSISFSSQGSVIPQVLHLRGTGQ